MKAKNNQWVMPEWMEQYRQYFVNTGGNSIEDLMNMKVDSRVNLPLAMLQVCVESQALLLVRLRNQGFNI